MSIKTNSVVVYIAIGILDFSIQEWFGLTNSHDGAYAAVFSYDV